MRAAVSIVIVGVIAWGFYVAFQGSKSFDPDKQGADARAAIHPGMTWRQVTDVAGQPKKYLVMHERVQHVGGAEIRSIEAGAANTFNAARLAERIEEGSLPEGFAFEYKFSNSVAFAVVFDATGNVTEVNDVQTMADLLQTREE